MKVEINWDRDGWRFSAGSMKSDAFTTYPDVVQAALAAGHEIDNAGWKHRLSMWNWNNHALDGYPGWDLDGPEEYGRRHPAFVKLTHQRSSGDVESHALAVAWDDVTTADFYQRDWTDDGIPFVREGETYWSGWWFATIAERDRFLKWYQAAAKKR